MDAGFHIHSPDFLPNDFQLDHSIKFLLDNIDSNVQEASLRRLLNIPKDKIDIQMLEQSLNGHSVRKLQKNAGGDVASLAGKLVNRWKILMRLHLEQHDVHSCEELESSRMIREASENDH